MNGNTAKQFILPAAIVVTLLIIGSVVYLNMLQKVTDKIQPLVSVTVVPSTLTPTPTTTVTATPTVAITIKPTTSDFNEIRAAVLLKSGIPSKKFEFSLGTNLGEIARGSVMNSDDNGGAAWYAGKINGVWKVSYIGQGVPLCSELAGINYPKNWISHCVNPQGNTVAR